MMQETKLEAVDDSKPIENVHGAIVKRSFTYNKRAARPGYCWFVYDINGRYAHEKAKAAAEAAGHKIEDIGHNQRFRKIQGAFEIEQEFVKTHGEENVKNMIIVNLLNKKKFFK